jgi:hypothetical protein
VQQHRVAARELDDPPRPGRRSELVAEVGEGLPDQRPGLGAGQRADLAGAEPVGERPVFGDGLLVDRLEPGEDDPQLFGVVEFQVPELPGEARVDGPLGIPGGEPVGFVDQDGQLGVVAAQIRPDEFADHLPAGLQRLAALVSRLIGGRLQPLCLLAYLARSVRKQLRELVDKREK